MAQDKISVIVEEIKEETPLVKSFKLTSADGYELPMFSGGSHITTYIDPPNQETLVRTYSLINNSKKTRYYQIAIQLNDKSQGGAFYWHHHVKRGDRLEISYPSNYFLLSFQAKHHVFFATGIGITPFLSMIEDIEHTSETFELHYAAKSKNKCAFYHFLKTNYPDQVNFYFSEDGNRMSKDLLENQPIGSHVYFCGTEEMINEFSKTARALGYPEKSIHFY
ncbi:flavodoxin reductases [Bacillus sp. OxB-1]|uniref:ferredoxin reductase n=1 Tax=Bacillus sp. (strain OxB-1) TaxID=98228 RepID=UPI000581CF4B|nr:ferredoxin reductase [Bacillus sp. OxB-1]BAQ08892.1 flavodoxin reductases [Bacillus sp. OxB-1]